MVISTHSLTRRLTRNPSIMLMVLLKFQLTASQGGWLCLEPDGIASTYFNSQPHKEADFDVTGGEPDEGISTHSLTRRLTMKIRVIHDFYDISTHSLTRRLTKNLKNAEYNFVISTHSLTRRLTAILDKNIFIQNWFFYLLYILVLFFIQIIIF